MAFFSKGFLSLALLSILLYAANAQLSPNFYVQSCPNVQNIVRSVMAQAVAKEARMGASILRLFFHDCFVNGCDGSILLDNAPFLASEKDAIPNNSARGYEVIDDIKTQVEQNCQATVSCADILALASRDAVNLLGGPTWTVLLGRKDSRMANQGAANNLPGRGSDLSTLISKFNEQGLDSRDLTALSGAHTIGLARCQQQTCQRFGTRDNDIAPFDEITPMAFDNAYYQDLVARRGLLKSDQALYTGGSGLTDALVSMYSANAATFANDFVNAMVKMGNIRPPPGMPGEVRLNCRMVN